MMRWSPQPTLTKLVSEYPGSPARAGGQEQAGRGPKRPESFPKKKRDDTDNPDPMLDRNRVCGSVPRTLHAAYTFCTPSKNSPAAPSSLHFASNGAKCPAVSSIGNFRSHLYCVSRGDRNLHCAVHGCAWYLRCSAQHACLMLAIRCRALCLRCGVRRARCNDVSRAIYAAVMQ